MREKGEREREGKIEGDELRGLLLIGISLTSPLTREGEGGREGKRGGERGRGEEGGRKEEGGRERNREEGRGREKERRRKGEREGVGNRMVPVCDGSSYLSLCRTA